MEVEILDRFAYILTSIRQTNEVTPQIIKETYALLDYTLANRAYEFVISSSWGPLNSVVCDYLMIRAEKHHDKIDAMTYKLTFSFFFKQGKYLHAAGAMMRLSELYLSQAMILIESDNYPVEEGVNQELEDSVRNILFEAQKAVSVASNVVGAMQYAPYFEENKIPKELMLGAKWGVSKSSQQSLVRSILQDAQNINANINEAQFITDNFHLIEQEELEWTAGQIQREFMKINAMLTLCTPDRRGYVASDGVSMLAACDVTTRCCLQPSQVLYVSVSELISGLACRGDIEIALSVCKAYSMGPNKVLQVVINHMILLLDSVLSLQNDTQITLVNSFLQIYHLLTTKTVHTYTIPDSQQILETQLKERKITNNDIREMQERFLCEINTCRDIVYDIVYYFADKDGFLQPTYCNNADDIFSAANLYAEILVSAIAAASRNKMANASFSLSTKPSELLKMLNLVLNGIIEKAMEEHTELFRLYVDRFNMQEEFKLQLSKLPSAPSNDEARVVFG